MNNIYIIILLSLLLTACGSQQRIKPDSDSVALTDTEGYMGIVINTLDPLTNIQLRNVESKKEFYVGGAKKGVSVLLLQLEEGEYCLVGFDVYDFRMDYVDKGFCTYIEAGEMNYFSEFLVRDPMTVGVTNYQRFVELLGRQYPKICEDYIGPGCS